MYSPSPDPLSPDNGNGPKSSDDLTPGTLSTLPPIFHRRWEVTEHDLRARFTQAIRAWLSKSPSRDTRSNYARDLSQFLAFVGIPREEPEKLAAVLPHQVAEWRDHLRERGLTNSSIR